MRKDRLSSFQAKKQKLLKIKKMIDNYQNSWIEIRTGKIRGNTIDPMCNSYNLLAEIWEIVKDE